MFSKNKSKSESKYGFFPGDSISTVAGSMRITGDLEADHDMRIDGKIYGNVYCKAKVVLGPTGVVEGDLHAFNADIFGSVIGNMDIKDMLCLKTKSNVSGNIVTAKLDIETDAEFNGTCTMVHKAMDVSDTKISAPDKAASLIKV